MMFLRVLQSIIFVVGINYFMWPLLLEAYAKGEVKASRWAWHTRIDILIGNTVAAIIIAYWMWSSVTAPEWMAWWLGVYCLAPIVTYAIYTIKVRPLIDEQEERKATQTKKPQVTPAANDELKTIDAQIADILNKNRK